MSKIICSVCNTEKNDNNFHKRENGKYRIECKKCLSNKGHIYYLKNKDKIAKKYRDYYYKNWEKKQIYRKNWFSKNKDKEFIYKKRYAQSKKGKMAFKRAYIKYCNKPENKLKKLAHWAIKYAVETGKIEKPNQCSDCKIILNTNKIQGHHFMGYEKKYFLSVKWLCLACHKKNEIKS